MTRRSTVSKKSVRLTTTATKKVATTTKAVQVNPVQVVRERVLKGIMKVLTKRKSWMGSMTDLGTVLVRAVRTVPSNWPATPRQLRSAVDTLVPELKRLGVRTSFGRTTDHQRKRFVLFAR